MSDIFQNIGNFLGSTEGKGMLSGAAVGGGFLQNWLANREAQKKQKFVEDLISNPAKFNQFVSGFEKPLSAGLTSDVARQADAYGAERGLSSSPAIMQSVFAQSLAPFVQQSQQTAEQAALQSLGIYESSPTTKPVDISSLLKVLLAAPPSQFPTFQPPANIEQPSWMPGGGPNVAPPMPTLPPPDISSDSSLSNLIGS